jgi:hypothetical protein
MMDGRVKPGHDDEEDRHTVMADMHIFQQNRTCWRSRAWA